MLNDKLNSISQDDFNFLIKNGKRSDKICNFDFESLIHCSWGLLKEQLPDLFSKGCFDILFYLLLKDRGVNLFLNDVNNISVNDALKFILWIRDELETIKQLEQNYLVSSPNAKMVQAGIHKLDQFGLMNTLDNLAGGDILKYDEVRKLKYSVVFDKQFREIKIGEIQTKLGTLK
jgi:hypothetical protein